MILETTDFLSRELRYTKKAGNVGWESPSNLAIVKYWGKYGNQLPCNPSLSITLDQAKTKTTIDYQYDPSRAGLDLEFYFENRENDAFEKRIRKYLLSIVDYFPFISHSRLIINSENSFPHSSGIASSASSMSALALCLSSIEKTLDPSSFSDDHSFFCKASFVARLGSGSACRSIYPHFALWGKSDHFYDSSDLFAKEFNAFHRVFDGLRNDILIVSKKEKSVSSSAGHSLMETNPYRSTRFDQARSRIGLLQEILNKGEVWDFGAMLESEALTLHALMMASDPSYILMEPNTISVLKAIREFRLDTKIPVFFSLDAGPNVHIISFETDRPKVTGMLESIAKYAHQNIILEDRIGAGPKEITR